MSKYSLQVILEQDEDGVFVASCPALQGCYAQGDTRQEALENIKDVIRMCLAELLEEGKPVDISYPHFIAIERIEVAV